LEKNSLSGCSLIMEEFMREIKELRKLKEKYFENSDGSI